MAGQGQLLKLLQRQLLAVQLQAPLLGEVE
jgi:hypothetical protein